ncbi:MAG: hypothetical protein EBR54_03125 [Flavobacteriia bacterium]|jgi:hypothetical protein|nr:hypothetical protein [Flavobacteriia bacterium]NBX38390.1 hypothetical protein [Flavobacteriia bacterium]
MFIDLQTIPKETIPFCGFKKKSFIPQEQQLRKQLECATALGNNYRTKVQIVFCDDEGLKMVYTTVWAALDKHIVLKGGIRIPIPRIVEIIF